jgi:hypothetical protein
MRPKLTQDEHALLLAFNKNGILDALDEIWTFDDVCTLSSLVEKGYVKQINIGLYSLTGEVVSGEESLIVESPITTTSEDRNLSDI